MGQGPKGGNSKPHLPTHAGNGGKWNSGLMGKNVALKARRSSYDILALFALFIGGTWAVYHYQFENLPAPLTLEEVGEREFSEYEAMKHARNLTQLGPHPVGSNALDKAVQYVAEASEIIKQTANSKVDVEVNLFTASSGANLMASGNFVGKTLAYSDLTYVALRIAPKNVPEAVKFAEAENSAILVSAHIDTVFSAEGAGDDTSSVAVMLELARGMSQGAKGFKNAVVYLFNTGEEDGLNGAHSFVTQHPWSDTLRIAIDLEAVGIGGKSSIFQVGPDPWAIENFAAVAKYPSGQIVSQDLFSSGFLNSATDFQVYTEVAGLSGLDFAFQERTAVYHTKNDKVGLLKPGSLQHLGENMLAFLTHVAESPNLSKGNGIKFNKKSDQDKAIYFDILGTYLITFRQHIAKMFYNVVIQLSFLLLIALMKLSGNSAAISLALSCSSVLLMWLCSISFSAIVALFLPLVSSSPVPYVSSPWLAAGLFGAPALLGAFVGQHMGYGLLVAYLSRTYDGRKDLSFSQESSVAKLLAERWLFKGGLLQWLVLLTVGNYYNIGSTYLALVWFLSPALAFGLLEETWWPGKLVSPLKTLTLVIGMFVPLLLSSAVFVRLLDTVIGFTVRMVSNPGANPDWRESLIVAIAIAVVVCLTMVYLLSYIHISGAKLPLIIATGILFALSLGAVWTGVVPPFTENTARGVNVVHVVDAGGIDHGEKPVSYLSLFSTTPGNLIEEANLIGEGFACGRDKYIDFVTFHVNYSCWTDKNAELDWQESDIPRIRVEKDTKGKIRKTQISIDTRASVRWALKINMKVIEDFRMEEVLVGATEANKRTDLIPRGEKSTVDGWHTIQFAGGTKSPTKFKLSLFWFKNATQTVATDDLLLRLRTDVARTTRPTQTVLEKLPGWCSLYGKSTSPHTLAFLTNLPISASYKGTTHMRRK